MYNTKFVSVNQIIDKIKRGKLFKELSYEAAIDYAVECYRLINTDRAEITKPHLIKIENHRGVLPEDLERVIQTVYTDKNLRYTVAMRYATNNFNEVFHCLNSPDLHCNTEYTYSLNNNYIHTSYKEGYAFMVYKALKTDDKGMIMIPDNVDVQLAVEFYVKWRYLDDLASDDPVVNRHLERNEQQYDWYIGKAQASLTDMSWDEYESFANSMSKFFDSENQHKSFLDQLGAKEYIRNQMYG